MRPGEPCSSAARAPGAIPLGNAGGAPWKVCFERGGFHQTTNYNNETIDESLWEMLAEVANAGH